MTNMTYNVTLTEEEEMVVNYVKLAEVPKPFSIKAGMEILWTANLDASHGNNDGYGSLGVLRLLACAILDNSFADEPEE